MKSDGSIIIDTKILDGGMEKGFEALKGEMKSVGIVAKQVGNQISMSFSQTDVTKPIANAASKVKALEQQLSAVTSNLKYAVEENDDRSSERLAAKQIKIYDSLKAARERLAIEISSAAKKQAAAEEKAAKKSAAAEERSAKKKIAAATKSMRRFNTRLGSIVSGALVFNIISQGLRSVTEYFGKALRSNEQFSTSVSNLKGALLTAFQPVYEYILPGLIKLIDIATVAAKAIGQIFAKLTGKSYAQMSQNAQDLYEQANAIEKLGKEAKKARGSLASFDEINRLSGGENSNDSNATAPNFKIDSNFEEISGYKNDLTKILGIVTAIGAAFLTWKIASIFTNNLKNIAGLALTVGGAFLYCFNWSDAFSNGIDWGNLAGMVSGVAAVAGGLALAFGSVGAAVGLIVGGVGMSVVALREWITTGELSGSACATLVGGITAIGLAISILTGNWIPLLVAAFAGFVIAAATNGDELKKVLEKISDWLNNVFSYDFRNVFGSVLGSALNGAFSSFQKFFSSIKQILFGVIDFINGIFNGDINKAFNGLLNIAKGVFNKLKTTITAPFDVLNSVVREIATKLLPESWKNGINSVISVVNRFISWLNRTLTFDIDPIEILGKTIFPGASISLVNLPQIPMLAQGAVIPPRSPFVAVLGDQRHGTNIEAPLSTIQEAVESVMASKFADMMDGFGETVAVLREILEAVYGIHIGDDVLGQAVDRYNRKLNIARGGPL